MWSLKKAKKKRTLILSGQQNMPQRRVIFFI